MGRFFQIFVPSQNIQTLAQFLFLIHWIKLFRSYEFRPVQTKIENYLAFPLKQENKRKYSHFYNFVQKLAFLTIVLDAFIFHFHFTSLFFTLLTKRKFPPNLTSTSTYCMHHNGRNIKNFVQRSAKILLKYSVFPLQLFFLEGVECKKCYMYSFHKNFPFVQGVSH